MTYPELKALLDAADDQGATITRVAVSDADFAALRPHFDPAAATVTNRGVKVQVIPASQCWPGGRKPWQPGQPE